MKIKDIFNIDTGNKLDFGKQFYDPNGVNFVSRNSNNNGVVGKISIEKNIRIYNAGYITVPLGGSYLLSCFVQNKAFVTAQNVHVLIPKDPNMLEIEKWFYCYVLRQNRFKFTAFGREVNKYLGDIEIPEKIPNWVYKSKLNVPISKNIKKTIPDFNFENWKKIKCKDLFEITRGKITHLNDLEEGRTPIVSAYGRNQGIQYYLNVKPEYENCLTVSFNGSGTGYCAYHGYKFNAGSDCGVLIPKFEMNRNVGLFIATIINQISYKYQFGRKMSVDRMENEYLYLPFKNECPDFIFMNSYINQLPNADLI